VHKELLILGMIGDAGTTTGYDLHRIIRAHGELFSDLKRPNMYHLLDRLASDGCLKVRHETGTRGRLGERRWFSLTLRGRRRFTTLLAEEVKTYRTVHTGVEVGMVFLAQLPVAEAAKLLRARQESTRARRRAVVSAFGNVSGRPFTQIAADHMLSLIDAELEWLSRAVKIVRGKRVR
jgi:DNA-binding PadR family transcriptional regulator